MMSFLLMEMNSSKLITFPKERLISNKYQDYNQISSINLTTHDILINIFIFQNILYIIK